MNDFIFDVQRFDLSIENGTVTVSTWEDFVEAAGKTTGTGSDQVTTINVDASTPIVATLTEAKTIDLTGKTVIFTGLKGGNATDTNDWNEHGICLNADSAVTLTITGGTISDSGLTSYSGENYLFSFAANVTATLTGVTINATKTNVSPITAVNSGAVVIDEGSTITATGHRAITVWGEDNTTAKVTVKDGATVTSQTNAAINGSSCEITIKGGTVSSIGASGGVIKFHKNDRTDAPDTQKLTITGGNLSCASGGSLYFSVNASGQSSGDGMPNVEASVTGGTFNVDPTDSLGDDVGVLTVEGESEDETYQVVAAGWNETTDGWKYCTLDEDSDSKEASQVGGTVELSDTTFTTAPSASGKVLTVTFDAAATDDTDTVVFDSVTYTNESDSATATMTFTADTTTDADNPTITAAVTGGTVTATAEDDGTISDLGISSGASVIIDDSTLKSTNNDTVISYESEALTVASGSLTASVASGSLTASVASGASLKLGETTYSGVSTALELTVGESNAVTLNSGTLALSATGTGAITSTTTKASTDYGKFITATSGTINVVATSSTVYIGGLKENAEFKISTAATSGTETAFKVTKDATTGKVTLTGTTGTGESATKKTWDLTSSLDSSTEATDDYMFTFGDSLSLTLKGNTD